MSSSSKFLARTGVPGIALFIEKFSDVEARMNLISLLQFEENVNS